MYAVRSILNDPAMKPLDGISVLLLEDEFLIALDAEQTLKRFGVHRVRIVNSLEAASEAAAHGGIDVAILDINISGQTSFEVATRLLGQGTPVIFASGYGTRRHDAPQIDGAIYLSKPYTGDALREALLAAITNGQASCDPVADRD